MYNISAHFTLIHHNQGHPQTEFLGNYAECPKVGDRVCFTVIPAFIHSFNEKVTVNAEIKSITYNYEIDPHNHQQKDSRVRLLLDNVEILF